MIDTRSVLALTLAQNIPSGVIRRLFSYYADFDEIWKESVFSLSFKTGIKQSYLGFLSKKDRLLENADREIDAALKRGIEIFSIFDLSYPDLLKQVYDPPYIIYALGNTDMLKKPMFAVVGTRKASIAALRMAYSISEGLSLNGITVVSGGALGIDTHAHKGALNEDGSTVCVLGSSLDWLYPRENKGLFSEIRKKGLIISEFRLDDIPKPYYFPKRNRIISGLSSGLLVVQAPKRSGALITAGFSLDQGRDVFTCEWDDRVIQGRGCGNLINDGAVRVSTAEEILSHMNMKINNKKPKKSGEYKKSLSELNIMEKRVVKVISGSGIHMNELIKKLDTEYKEIVPVLMKLELKGFIKSHIGEIYTPAF